MKKYSLSFAFLFVLLPLLLFSCNYARTVEGEADDLSISNSDYGSVDKTITITLHRGKFNSSFSQDVSTWFVNGLPEGLSATFKAIDLEDLEKAGYRGTITVSGTPSVGSSSSEGFYISIPKDCINPDISCVNNGVIIKGGKFDIQARQYAKIKEITNLVSVVNYEEEKWQKYDENDEVDGLYEFDVELEGAKFRALSDGEITFKTNVKGSDGELIEIKNEEIRTARSVATFYLDSNQAVNYSTVNVRDLIASFDLSNDGWFAVSSDAYELSPEAEDNKIIEESKIGTYKINATKKVAFSIADDLDLSSETSKVTEVTADLMGATYTDVGSTASASFENDGILGHKTEADITLENGDDSPCISIKLNLSVTAPTYEDGSNTEDGFYKITLKDIKQLTGWTVKRGYKESTDENGYYYLSGKYTTAY